MNLVKKKKLKKEISKVKLIKIIRSCKEYNTFRDSYNLSKINLRKYLSIFHNLYNNTQQQKQYQEVDENHKGEGLQKNAFISSTLINRDISLLCPFCNDIFFLKNDLLNHIANIHNINKNFSDIINFFSKSNQLIHKKLSHFLKYKNRFNNESNHVLQYDINQEYKKKIYEKQQEQVEKGNILLSLTNQHDNENHTITNKQHMLSKNEMICKQSNVYIYNNDNGINKNNKKKKNKHLYMYNLIKNDKNKFPQNVNNMNYNKPFLNKYLNYFLERIKIKYTLRIVYIYFVTIMVQLIMSQKKLNRQKKKKNANNNNKINNINNINFINDANDVTDKQKKFKKKNEQIKPTSLDVLKNGTHGKETNKKKK